MRSDLSPTVPDRFSVHLIKLNQTVRSEIRKERPCAIVSPYGTNKHLATVIMAPMTTKGFPYLSRVKTRFGGRAGFILLDQMRTIEQIHLGKPIGKITVYEEQQVIRVLAENIFKMPSFPSVGGHQSRLANNKVRRFGVYMVSPDPTVGMKTQAQRLCVVVSPDNMNTRLNTVLVAPLHERGSYYPTRVKVRLGDKKQFILLDQIRAVDKSRLIKHHDAISTNEARQVIDIYQEMFPY